MTDATPTPMPPTTRNRPTIHTLAARPVPKALIEEQHRGDLHHREPADLVGEPVRRSWPRAAAPSSAEATAKPNAALLIWNVSLMADTAPLMTALS